MTDHPVARTPKPDQRTPGQVALEILLRIGTATAADVAEQVAAAVLAHDAAARTARGEVVIARRDLSNVLTWRYWDRIPETKRLHAALDAQEESTCEHPPDLCCGKHDRHVIPHCGCALR